MNYVGIDIGDGESCVCLLPFGSGIEPQPVTITGRKSFLSAVALKADGTPVIGMDAVGKEPSKAFSVRFKSRFLSGSTEAMEDMRRFLQGLYQELALNRILTEDDKVTIGCPAGWGESARQKYLDMIRQAGFPNARLVSESRGAFLYAKHAKTIQLDSSLIDRSALVIDIGSSTLDFAYVVDGKETNVGVFGDVYLGGGAIDEAILAAAVSASNSKAEIERVFQESPSWRSHCLLSARRLKEDYFTAQSQGETNIQSEEMVTILYDEPVNLHMQVNDALILRVIALPIAALAGKSFSGMLSDALRSAAKKTSSRPPELVLLTGGASRMGFFQEQCRKQFPNANIVLCQEPEFSIAKGLAYSAKVDEQIQAFNEDIDAYLKTEEIGNAAQSRLESLLKAVADHVSSLCCQTLQAEFVLWQNGTHATLADMQSAVGKAVDKALKTEQERTSIGNLVANELAEVCSTIQPKLDEICLRHGIAVSRMQLNITPEIIINPPDNLGAQLTFLSDKMQLAIVALVGGVLLAIPGGGILDVLLFAAAAVAVRFLNMPINEFALHFNVSGILRRFVSPNQVVTKKLRQDMTDNLYKNLNADAKFKESVIGDIRESVSAYVKGLAKKTEIAIQSGRNEL